MTLDPQARHVLELAERSERPLLETLDPPQARAQYAEMVAAAAGDPPGGVETTDRTVDGAAGELRVRTYRPESAESALPGLVYFHGGGFVIGDLDTHDIPCRRLALSGECVVVSVDYRLAPEHPFPTPVTDAWAATRSIVKDASVLGIDPLRLAVGGDSAGGTLAATVARFARDAGDIDLAVQLLIYPATDLAGRHESYERLGEDYRLTKALMNWFMDHYFADGADRSQTLASPLHAPEFKDLAPALVLTAGYDPLVDEGRAYGDALRKAGVEVELLEYEGMIHGFITMGGLVDAAEEALDRCGAALRRAFQVGGAAP